MTLSIPVAYFSFERRKKTTVFENISSKLFTEHNYFLKISFIIVRYHTVQYRWRSLKKMIEYYHWLSLGDNCTRIRLNFILEVNGCLDCAIFLFCRHSTCDSSLNILLFVNNIYYCYWVSGTIYCNIKRNDMIISAVLILES